MSFILKKYILFYFVSLKPLIINYIYSCIILLFRVFKKISHLISGTNPDKRYMLKSCLYAEVSFNTILFVKIRSRKQIIDDFEPKVFRCGPGYDEINTRLDERGEGEGEWFFISL